MFDRQFYIHEKIRFDMNLHPGKRQAIKRYILPNLIGKRVLDFGCGGGNYTKMLTSVADSVTAVDFPPALEFAKQFNPSPKIEYTETPTPADVTVCIDSLEFVSNWQETLEKIRSPLTIILCPSFSPATLASRVYWKLSPFKRGALAALRHREGSIYHQTYNRDFRKQFEEAFPSAHKEKVCFGGSFLYFLP